MLVYQEQKSKCEELRAQVQKAVADAQAAVAPVVGVAGWETAARTLESQRAANKEALGELAEPVALVLQALAAV
eukprot:10746587-Prorocentrum_lima.AAC.1